LREDGKSKKRSDQTRQGIFDALLSLLDEMPYEKINISAITEKAGVARQSFYRNYKTKDDVVREYLSELFERVKCSVCEPFERERIQEIYSSLLTALCSHKNKLVKLVDSKLELLILEPMEKLSTFIVEKFYAGDGRRLRREEKYIVRYHSGGVMNIILGWLKYDMDEPAERMAALISKFLSSPAPGRGFAPAN
jgi:AcrR family transcriptional regulator